MLFQLCRLTSGPAEESDSETARAPFLSSRERSRPPSGQEKFSVPLSVVKTTMVLSSTPKSFSLHCRTDDVVQFSSRLQWTSRFRVCAVLDTSAKGV